MPGNVLIVEDDGLIALDFEDIVRASGVPVVRVAARVAQALDMIDDSRPDFAFLNVALAGDERSFAIAERLAGYGVPFAFVTGAPARLLPAAFIGRPMLNKPYSADAIRAQLLAWKDPFPGRD